MGFLCLYFHCFRDFKPSLISLIWSHLDAAILQVTCSVVIATLFTNSANYSSNGNFHHCELCNKSQCGSHLIACSSGSRCRISENKSHQLINDVASFSLCDESCGDPLGSLNYYHCDCYFQRHGVSWSCCFGVFVSIEVSLLQQCLELRYLHLEIYCHKTSFLKGLSCQSFH